ncbi:MAG: hypothetical protein AAFV88_10105 [Planctomycetota bacterium]
MKVLLGISGVITLIVLSCPMLVVLGFVFLILPGVILLVMPTVFTYSFAFALVQRILPIENSVRKALVGLATICLVSYCVVQPGRMRETARFQSQVLPDVSCDQTIRPSGHVRLELWDEKRPASCNDLCSILLTLPEVESVTIETAHIDRATDSNSVAAFQLVDAAEQPGLEQPGLEQPGLEQPGREQPDSGLFPTQLDRLARLHPDLHREIFGKSASDCEQLLIADWALRLADQKRLVAADPVPREEADWVVRLEQKRKRGSLRLKRIEIIDPGKKAVFRSSHVSHLIPARCFYFGFDFQFGSSLVNQASFRVGCERLEFGSSDLELIPALWSVIPAPDFQRIEDAKKRLRQRTEEVLDDPAATDASLTLPGRWLSTFFFDASEEDVRFIASVLVDERVPNVAEPLRKVLRKGQVPLELGVPIAARIQTLSTSGEDRRWLAERLAELPAGAFAKPHESHLAIWQDPVLRLDAAPFLKRAADMNADEAMPLLMDGLEQAITLEPWNRRRYLVKAVREGFELMGERAGEAVPRVRELFLLRPSPILSNAGDAQDWRISLLKMGVEIDDLPFFESQNEAMIRNIKDRLRKKMSQKG